VYADVIARIDAMHSDVITGINATNRRFDAVHSDLITRIDTTNARLNRLYEVIVRREEHDGLRGSNKRSRTSRRARRE
jgi:hypothetical protein